MNLEPHKPAGPDKVFPKVLKEAATGIPLTSYRIFKRMEVTY